MSIPDGGNYAKSNPVYGPPAPPPAPKAPANVQDRAQKLVEDSGATKPKQTPAESKQNEAKLGKNVAAEVVKNPEGASKLISEINRNLPANMQHDVALETATSLSRSQKRELAKTPDGRRALETLGVVINNDKKLEIDNSRTANGPTIEEQKHPGVREIQSVIQDQAKEDAASVRATYDTNSGNPPQAAEKSSAKLDQLIRDDTDADAKYDEKATQDSFYSQQLVEQSESTIKDIGRVAGDNAGGKYADSKEDKTAVKNTLRNLASVVENAPGVTDKIAVPISDAMTHDASGKAHDRDELYQVDDAFYNHEDSGGSIKLFRAIETDLRGKGFNTAADELRDRNGDRFSLGGAYRGIQNFELSAIDKAGGISDGINGLNSGDSYKVSGSFSDSVGGAKNVRLGVELSTEIKREGDTYNVTATGKGSVGGELAKKLGGEEVKVGADGSVKMQFSFTNKEDAIRAARTLGGIEAGTLAIVASVDAAAKTGHVEVAAVGGAIGVIAIANPSGFRFLNNHLSAIEGGVGVNANVGIDKGTFKDLGIEVKGSASLSGSMRTEYVGGKAVARVWSATAELGVSAEAKDVQRTLGPWGRSTVKATGLGSIEASQSVTISRREPLEDVKSDQRVEYTVSTTSTLKGKVEGAMDYNQFVKDNLGGTGRMTGKVSNGESVTLEKETSYSGQSLKDIGHRFVNDQVFGPVFVGPQDNKVIVKSEVKVFGTSSDSLGTEGKGESIGLPDLQFSREKKVKIAG
jgi:hypothetical protein